MYKKTAKAVLSGYKVQNKTGKGVFIHFTHSFVRFLSDFFLDIHIVLLKVSLITSIVMIKIKSCISSGNSKLLDYMQ